MNQQIPNDQFSSKKRLLVFFILLLALGLYIFGVFAPLMTVKKAILFIPISGKSASIADGLWQFLLDGSYVLFLIIFVFTIIFPLFKFYVLFSLCRSNKKDRAKTQHTLQRLASISKWSMLDVFVVAILIVAVKIRSLLKVEVHYGLYVFSISIIMTMLLTYFLAHPKKTANNHAENSE